LQKKKTILIFNWYAQYLKNVSRNHVFHSNHMFMTAGTRLTKVTTFKQYHKPGLLQKNAKKKCQMKLLITGGKKLK